MQLSLKLLAAADVVGTNSKRAEQTEELWTTFAAVKRDAWLLRNRDGSGRMNIKERDT
jgi:hypothetical protein